jgi:hypothetical protein
MRIKIAGENDAALELAGLLRHERYLVTDKNPTHSIILEEEPEVGSEKLEGVSSSFSLLASNSFLVDGIDCPLEKRVTEHIHQLTGKNPILDRTGPVRSDRELRVRFHSEDAHNVALGAFRGLLEVIQRDAKLAMESALPEQMARSIAEGYWAEFAKQVRLGVESALKESAAASLADLKKTVEGKMAELAAEITQGRSEARAGAASVSEGLAAMGSRSQSVAEMLSQIEFGLTKLIGIIEARLNRPPWWKRILG